MLAWQRVARLALSRSEITQVSGDVFQKSVGTCVGLSRLDILQLNTPAALVTVTTMLEHAGKIDGAMGGEDSAAR